MSQKSGKMLQKLLISVGLLAVLLYFIPRAIRLATDLVLGTVEEKMCDNSVRFTIESLSTMGRGYVFLPPIVSNSKYDLKSARSEIPNSIKAWVPGYLDKDHPLTLIDESLFELNNNQLNLSGATLLQYLYNRFPESCSGKFGYGEGVDMTHLVSHSRLKNKRLRVFITTYNEELKGSHIEEITNETCPERPVRIRPPSGEPKYPVVDLPKNTLPESKKGFHIRAQLDYTSVEGSEGSCFGETKQRYDYDLFNSASQPRLLSKRKTSARGTQLRVQFINIEPGSAIVCGSGTVQQNLKWQVCSKIGRIGTWTYQDTNNSAVLDIQYQKKGSGTESFGITTVDTAGNISEPLIVSL